jgi:hypothetical protein
MRLTHGNVPICTDRHPWDVDPNETAFTEMSMNRRTHCAVVRRVCAGLSLGCLTGLLAGPATAADPAQETSNTVEITPFLGTMGGGKFEDPTDGSDRDLDGGTNWGVFVDISAGSPERQYEMFYTQQGTTVKGAEPFDMDVQYLHIGGIVNFTDVSPVVPYFGMTVGATRFGPNAGGLDDETKVSFSAGGGLKYLFSDHFGLRFDARAYLTLLDTDSDIFCVSAPESGAGCRISAASDTFLQYSATLGFVAAF